MEIEIRYKIGENIKEPIIERGDNGKISTIIIDAPFIDQHKSIRLQDGSKLIVFDVSNTRLCEGPICEVEGGIRHGPRSFHKNGANKAGLDNYCIECRSEIQKVRNASKEQ
jgi:hypothetical protein